MTRQRIPREYLFGAIDGETQQTQRERVPAEWTAKYNKLMGAGRIIAIWNPLDKTQCIREIDKHFASGILRVERFVILAGKLGRH